jgi:hypothetical protein
MMSNFVKQIKQAILLRSIQKQEKLLIQTLKHKLHEDTALAGNDNGLHDNPSSLATYVPNEEAVRQQSTSSEPSEREGSGLQDRTTDRLKFKTQ